MRTSRPSGRAHGWPGSRVGAGESRSGVGAARAGDGLRRPDFPKPGSRWRPAASVGDRAEALALVGTGEDGLPPGPVRQVPLDGLREAGGEVVGRRPGELLPDLRRVDRVAPVVAGAVGDESLEVRVGVLAGALQCVVLAGREPGFELGAQGVDDLEVRALAVAADVVLLAEHACFEHPQDAAAVVVDIEPVPDVPAVAVDGQVPALHGVQDHERDELLGELVRAVVVRAVRDEGRQPEGVLVRPDQVVRAGLGGGVGRVRCVRGLFREEAVRAQRAVHLVGRDVEEAEGARLRVVELRVVLARRVEELEGAHDVGLDERLGAVDRAVHVALGGEVQDGVGPVVADHLLHRRPIRDVRLDEVEAVAPGAVREALEVARVGELVDDHHVGRGLVQDHAHQVRADEAGPSGDDPGRFIRHSSRHRSGGSGSGPAGTGRPRPADLGW